MDSRAWQGTGLHSLPSCSTICNHSSASAPQVAKPVSSPSSLVSSLSGPSSRKTSGTEEYPALSQLQRPLQSLAVGLLAGISWPQGSKSGGSGPASAVGGLPRQQCCAFKDPHVMWGHKIASKPLPSLLHWPICHLGFSPCVFHVQQQYLQGGMVP